MESYLIKSDDVAVSRRMSRDHCVSIDVIEFKEMMGRCAVMFVVH